MPDAAGRFARPLFQLHAGRLSLSPVKLVELGKNFSQIFVLRVPIDEILQKIISRFGRLHLQVCVG